MYETSEAFEPLPVTLLVDGHEPRGGVDYTPGIWHALDGYARDGDAWKSAERVFRRQFAESNSVDSALRVALDAAHEGAETTWEDAYTKFWDYVEGPEGPHVRYSEAVQSAMDGFARDRITWFQGYDAFFQAIRFGTTSEEALAVALDVTKEGAESSPGRARQAFAEQMGVQLKGDVELIQASRFKSGKFVFGETVGGERVIVKYAASENLENERDVLQSVQGPGIPRVLGYDDIGEFSRMELERMPGIGLDDLISLNADWTSVPQSTRVAAEIVGQLADRFKSVSRGGYLYRDLNLAHVLVDLQSDPTAVGLIDVEKSLAKTSREGGTVDRPQGTWETMAPEEFQAGDTMTEASNVYSLGVVLAQLVTGRNPFSRHDDNPEKQAALIEAAHLRGLDPGQLKGVPLGNVIARALQPNPANRYQSIREFRDALRLTA